MPVELELNKMLMRPLDSDTDCYSVYESHEVERYINSIIANSWIKLSDHQPDIGVRVEAYMPIATENKIRILHLGPYDPDDGGSQWLEDDDEDDVVGYVFGAVTHWRPLPKEPVSI